MSSDRHCGVPQAVVRDLQVWFTNDHGFALSGHTNILGGVPEQHRGDVPNTPTELPVGGRSLLRWRGSGRTHGVAAGRAV